ncbi:hemocyte protein-glutamine gamma-glutamyltransferase-like [Dermacentor variabilis]|uniref:hemocyte protein-glutamine gamma-glutamyltransferase-like n=1 Tax=Dermacentor variabilis TaxID=34621 RepID=UPI003F5B2566
MSGYGWPYVIYPNWNAYAAHTLATARNALEERERRLSEERARRREHQGNAIKVDAVDLYSKDNAKHHHTEMFDSLERSDPPLIIRRGQPFLLAVRFKREYQPGVDDVSLDFSIGPKPEISKGTFVSLRVPDTKGNFSRAPQSWDVRLTHHDRAVICVQVFAPANVSVGLWRVAVLSWSRANPEAKDKYRHPSDIYVLFNPWCKDDLVYMDNEDWRREYVLNDVGKVYVGSWKQPWGRPWIFGQFEDIVLPTCSLVLDKSELSHAARADPVKVVRAISAVVNSNDEGGILAGNWSGNYEGGISPMMWTGSSAILERYVKNGGTSVNYGQCWVFAAVCNTVCRALGIPCRPVTCFASAHDTDETITIDRYFDEDGKEMEGLTTDSIWNFHVWNEVWMARKDLPPGYGGWQVIDPTPQERSRGFYQLGPCSVMAVKKGEVGYNYDSRFVFAEVNADVIHWKKDPASDFGWSRSMTLTYQVGQALLTKKANVPIQEGIGDAEDITHCYKDKEGTKEERRTVLKAVRQGALGALVELPIESKQDVSLKMQDIESVMIGKPFTVTVIMRNESQEQRTVHTVLYASSVYYTGILADNIKRSMGTFVLRPQQEEVLTMTVQPEEYLNKLVDFAMVKIYVFGNVKETGERLSDEDDFTITTPKLDMQVDGPVKVGHPCKLVMRFTNPLNVPLRDCALAVAGTGFTSAQFVPVPNVAPRAEWAYRETIVPVKSGPLSVVAVFNCRELSDIPGSVQMVVEGSPAPTFGGALNYATAWLPRFL